MFPVGTSPVRVLTPPTTWIPLDYAGLCVNHDNETLFDIRQQRECPTCGSRNWALLTQWLQERTTR